MVGAKIIVYQISPLLLPGFWCDCTFQIPDNGCDLMTCFGQRNVSGGVGVFKSSAYLLTSFFPLDYNDQQYSQKWLFH